MLNALPYQEHIQKALHFIHSIKINAAANTMQKFCTDTRQYQKGNILIAYNIPHIDIKHQVSNFQHVCNCLNKELKELLDNVVNNIYVIADAYFLTYMQKHETQLHQSIHTLNNVHIIYLPDLYKYLGHIISAYYAHPSHKHPIIGITGTNGKTTISHWLAQCMNAIHQNQQATCVIGTLGSGYLNNLHVTGFTTPDVVQLQQQLQEYSNQDNIKAISMEVSSHGLIQYRVAGIQFHAAIFTNLSQDHLDYHLTLQEYAYAKSILFQSPLLKYAIINADDAFGLEQINTIISNASSTAHNTRYIAYGKDKAKLDELNNYIYLKQAELFKQGYLIKLELVWQNEKISDTIYVPIFGEFNLYNLMAVIGGLLSLEYKWEIIKHAVETSLFSVKGRLEVVKNKKNTQNKLVLVDYAHTPDALEKTLQVLQSIAKERQGKLYCVFGCGGNRDKTKRPIMTKVAISNADMVFLTSDNPRFEQAQHIIEDMQQGIEDLEKHKMHIIIDRKEAISAAIKSMQNNDVLVIAGKGHECYQEINGIKYVFDDAEHAENALDID
jgi:UDP-N-acetylmuramoyl-L-alanyl-D-glutamate--2,6-diaminopimelate ligase